jgi:hypothetical protein
MVGIRRGSLARLLSDMELSDREEEGDVLLPEA